MSEQLRSVDYNEDQYFNRKVSNHYNYDRPQVSNALNEPNYGEPYEESESQSQNFVAKKKWKLSKFEISWLVICGIISVIIISTSFIVRRDIMEQTRSINNLEVSIAEYESSTKVLKSQITEQYNYDQIKEAAAENGMVVDKDRVRTVEK